MTTGNVPLYARKDVDLNTVQVIDSVALPDGRNALLVVLEDTTGGSGSTTAVNYDYTFGWTAGNLTSIERNDGTTSQSLTLTWDAQGQLTNISKWA